MQLVQVMFVCVCVFRCVLYCIGVYIYNIAKLHMIPVASHSTPYSNSLPKQSSPFTRGSPPVCLGYVTEVTRAQPQISITIEQWLTWSPQVGTCIHSNHPHIVEHTHLPGHPPERYPHREVVHSPAKQAP